MNSTAEVYMELVGEGSARLALLACSAALRLDDNVAREAIQLVAQSNGSTDKTLRRIKRLGCVWKQWDGSWYIAEDVRSSFLERLYEEVPEATIVELRERLATHASRRTHALPDGVRLFGISETIVSSNVRVVRSLCRRFTGPSWI